MADEEAARKEASLVVGVDYGTTYTGVASGLTGLKNIDSISVINSWPGRGNVDESKTPSAIVYGTGSGYPNGYRWGSDIPARTIPHLWVKMLLNEAKNRPETAKIREGAPDGFMTIPPGKEPVDVVADYLTGVYKWTMEKLLLSHGSDFMNVTPIEFVLTVPAIWSDKARSLTQDAARRAGFASRPRDKLTMVSEPEAAAIYTIRSTFNADRGNVHQLKLGECFVMCDAGGGTVDLITYQVVQTEPDLKIAEIVIGSGGACGSTFIDTEFQALVGKRLGKKLETVPLTKRGPGSRFMQDFELVKRSYGTSTIDQPHYLTLHMHDAPEARVADSEFELLDEEIQAVFTPIVNKVIGLLEGQIKGVHEQHGKVKHIMLVGGFGESDYLLKCLRDHRWPEIGKIEILRPDKAWSAVARGAVLWGLEGNLVVDKRKCRRHYGTELLKHFDPNIHDEEDAMVSFFTNLKMAKNQVSWIVNRGQKTDSDKRFRLSCVTSFHKGEKLIHTTQLVACDSDVASTHLRNPEVYELCLLTADLSNVPESEFDECIIGNKTFLRAEFSIELTFLSADIKFETWFKGKCYGAVKTKY